MPTVLITGINGFIGQHLAEQRPPELSLHGTIRSMAGWPGHKIFSDIQPCVLNLTEEIDAQLPDLQPDLVIHTAAMAALAACQADADLARRVNSTATRQLARWSARNGSRFIYLSTDIVFRGDNPPYNEESKPDPVNVYGQTKLDGEHAVIQNHAHYAILRISLSLGRGRFGKSNFIDWFLERLENEREIPLFSDEIRTPTSVVPLTRKIWDIALDRTAQGIFHLCGASALDRLSLGGLLCDRMGRGHELLRPVSLKEMKDYPRPVDVSLVSTRRAAGRSLRMDGIEKYLAQILAG